MRDMHLHIGILQALIAFASVLFFGTLWRLVAAHNSDNALGKAMSFMY